MCGVARTVGAREIPRAYLVANEAMAMHVWNVRRTILCTLTHSVFVYACARACTLLARVCAAYVFRAALLFFIASGDRRHECAKCTQQRLLTRERTANATRCAAFGDEDGETTWTTRSTMASVESYGFGTPRCANYNYWKMWCILLVRRSW